MLIGVGEIYIVHSNKRSHSLKVATDRSMLTLYFPTSKKSINIAEHLVLSKAPEVCFAGALCRLDRGDHCGGVARVVELWH